MPRTALEHFSAIDGYVTPDTAKALKALMDMAGEAGMDLNPQPVVGSYAPAGRSVSVRLDGTQPQLNKLWSIAVPLGFTPWSRYPIPGTINETLYFLGPWQAVLDRLCAEGRGHLSWPAMCKAAWADATLELNEISEIEELNVFIQAQLHRLGFNAGNLDGVLGTRTKQALPPSVWTVQPSLNKTLNKNLNKPLNSPSNSRAVKRWPRPTVQRMVLGAVRSWVTVWRLSLHMDRWLSCVPHEVRR